jgi:hypothetical protein
VPYNLGVLGLTRSPSPSPSLSPSLSLSLSLALLLLSSCTGQCTRGPTTTCWCPGDAVGESTCGEDGRYGACVCPGSTGSAPAPVVPTSVVPVAPVAPPPPPAPLGPMVPSTIPLGVDPPPSGASGSRDAAIALWLAGPLRGHDNRSAAMRAVSITGATGVYQIYVQNQFGFRCDLDFDAAGNPSAMRDCRSREPDWSAQPALIAVTCEDRGGEIHCEAPYQLRTRDGYQSRETFVFSRGARTRPVRPSLSGDGVLDPWAH